jgi:hypothetical protein
MNIFLKYIGEELKLIIDAPILSGIIFFTGYLIAKWYYKKIINDLKSQSTTIDQKKNNLNNKDDVEYRRSLIVKWRTMVNEIIKEKDKTKTKASILLERHKDYHSLKPHLSEDTLCQLCRATMFTAGSTISPPLEFMLDDIDKIEKKWKLI